jgi:hypothetical protein
MGTIYGCPWEVELSRKRLNPLRALLIGGCLEAPIAAQRNGTTDRGVGAITPFAVFDLEVLIKEPPPQHHRLAGQIRIDLIRDAVN